MNSLNTITISGGTTPQQIEEWAAMISAVKAICESAAPPEAKMRLIRRMVLEPSTTYPFIYK